MRRSRSVGVTLVALLLCSLLDACTGGGGSSGDADEATVLRGTECREGSAALCLRLGGEIVLVPDGMLDLSRPITIVDPGGPGFDATAQAAAIEPYAEIPNVLVVAEPWVGAETAAGCRRALDAYMTKVRRAGPLTGVAGSFASACSPELAAESDFAEHGIDNVATALRAHGVQRLVLLGASFGAQRILHAATAVDTVVLVAPFVARESLRDDLERRIRRSYGVLGLGATERRDLATAAAQLPARVPGRSVDFTATDLDAAVISAAYDPDHSRGPLLQDVRALDATARTRRMAAVTWIPKAADYLEGRYESESYYRGLVGYFGNYCASYFDRSVGQHRSPTGRFLVRFHAACSELDVEPHREVIESDADGCVVLGTADPVASRPETIRQRFPNLEQVFSRSRGHATVDALALGISLVRSFIARDSTSCPRASK